MSMSGTMPMMVGGNTPGGMDNMMGNMGDMDQTMGQMMGMMKRMNAHMSRMEAMMAQMSGTMPMTGTGSMMAGGSMDDMMGKGGMMGATQAPTTTMAPGAGKGPGPRAGANSSAERSADFGGTEVKVTPVNLASPSGDSLDFTVDFEGALSSPDLDLAPLAQLVIGDQSVAADSWKVNFDHGHHVNGTLSFPLEQVKTALIDGANVELTVAQPDGGSPAVFTWDSAK
jgi:hypothetical protein